MTDTSFSFLQAVIFDWAGTTVDWGCQTPVLAFQQAFAACSVPISIVEARQPMGLGKRDHVAALCAMPRVRSNWLAVHGHLPDTADIDYLYMQVTRQMAALIADSGEPLPGVVQSVETMRKRGLRIGSCTGYPREVAVLLAGKSAQFGYRPEVLLCANDVANPRPGPEMCEAALRQLGISDPALAVKVGDTVHDVQEGLAAGMWTIGITLTGSLVGVPKVEFSQLPVKEQERQHCLAEQILLQAGAHFVASSVADCVSILETIDGLLSRQQRPTALA